MNTKEMKKSLLKRLEVLLKGACNSPEVSTIRISLAIIDQLEADKLEAYKAIVGNCEYEYTCPEYGSIDIVCKFCEEDIISHDKDCIVNKANKYIEGIT